MYYNGADRFETQRLCCYTGEDMIQNKKESVRQSLFGLTAAGKVFSCALAFAGCLSLNIYAVFVCCAVCFAASVFLKDRILCPAAFLIVPLVFVAQSVGRQMLLPTVLVGAVLFFLSSLTKSDRTFPHSVTLGASVGLAFCVTALLTTYYFGIGASGATAFEMLKNYRYLGFHPNWRGVFYGTITLFAMITYPFKFRKLSQYLPAEVVSLAIPFVLNLFLNPNGETTPILELGDVSSLNVPFFVRERLGVGTEPTVRDCFLTVVQGALAIAAIMFIYSEKSGKTPLITASANAVSGIFGGIPSLPTEIKSYSVSACAVAAASAAAVGCLAPSLIARLPLHSLAVVLIVSAWKEVPFSEFSKMFKTEKFLGAVFLTVTLAAFVFLGVFSAFVVCMLLSLLNAFIERRRAR